MFELQRINCVWISVSYFRSNTFFFTVKSPAASLEGYVLQVQQEGKSCIIDSVKKPDKQSEFILMNHLTMKDKILLVKKLSKRSYSSLVKILMSYSSISTDTYNSELSVIQEVKNVLSLKKFAVTDNGKTIMTFTYFDDMIEYCRIKLNIYNKWCSVDFTKKRKKI